MKLSKFKFNLDEERIAQFPVHHDQPSKDRDDAKMLVVHKKTGEIEHKQFKNIIDYFDDKDVFVFNDTKVFPSLRQEGEDRGADRGFPLERA